MSNLVSEDLRVLVRSRAERLCEYCLMHEDDCLFSHQVDHIISLKHAGATESENLALASIICNRHKGSDVGTILSSGIFTRFFNPRTDCWSDHFRFEADAIDPLTLIGEATACIFKFNDSERIIERAELAARGRYPTLEALGRMRG